jgi:hypothetical protein
MVIDHVTLELRRTGDKATFLVQGRPIGVAMHITLPELEHLALYLAHEVGLWRDEQLDTEAAAVSSQSKL